MMDFFHYIFTHVPVTSKLALATLPSSNIAYNNMAKANEENVAIKMNVECREMELKITE